MLHSCDIIFILNKMFHLNHAISVQANINNANFRFLFCPRGPVNGDR
jgi:hypothetical protein